jgi:hypothetical protein
MITPIFKIDNLVTNLGCILIKGLFLALIASDLEKIKLD